MKAKCKKIIAAVAAAGMIFGLSACGGSSSESGSDSVTIAYQYGMAYAPFEVMKEQGTGGEIL